LRFSTIGYILGDMTELLIKLFLHKDASRHEYGVLAGIVGIFCNLILTAFKIVTGIATGAVSIATDAVNNLSDAVSSIVTLIGFKITGKPADKEHPYGHGRAEYLTGFIVSAAVIAIALTLLKESISHIINPNELDVSITTIIILSASILLKLWMSLFYTKIARRIDSEAMMATATDSRSDCITTGVALIAALVMLIWQINIDGIAGAVVALFVIWSGFKSAKETIEPLLGTAPDKDLTEKIVREALSHKEILNVHDIRIHEYGHGMIIVSMHVEMPYTLSLIQAHDVVDSIERAVTEDKLATEITIHVDPVNTDDDEMLDLRKDISNHLLLLDDRITIHDFKMQRCEDRRELDFELLVPYDLNKTDDEIKDHIRKILDDRTVIRVTVDRE